MSERYSRLFSLPENLYAEGAPVVIAAGALLKDNQADKIVAQLKMRNISQKSIKAVTVCIHPLDTVGNSLGEEIESLQNMIFSTKARQEKSSAEEWKWINWQIADTTRLMKLEYICSMDEKHHLDYIILTTDNSMMKIGQYPSIADMTFPELDAYKHVISKQDRKELGTAIGLFASGIGAGSYVYLRRILERLIYQAKATAGDKVNDEEFEQARVAERIKMLQGYLPEILIKNTTIYGILSKGIHELSEEECKKYFPVVKECIYQILGMWESERRKKADEDALSKALSSISSSIK